jgi:hypothetical protein
VSWVTIPTRRSIPAIAVVEEAARNLRGYLAAFGLLPADEARLGLKRTQTADSNPFAGGGVK